MNTSNYQRKTKIMPRGMDYPSDMLKF